MNRPIETCRYRRLGFALALMFAALLALGACDAISNKVKCRTCDGTGDCQGCGGDGYFGILPCCETGECQACNGYGYTID